MTRIAVISDMHGNCVAFDAVLADLSHDHIGQVVCLGDAIQGVLSPPRWSRGCAIWVVRW
jgi:predicted phosphodiesterase